MSKNENEICRSPPGGVNSFTWPKLTTANDKVKFMDGGFLTLVFTFFLIIFIHVLWIRNFVVCLHHRNEAIPKHHDYESNVQHPRQRKSKSLSSMGERPTRWRVYKIRPRVVVVTSYQKRWTRSKVDISIT